MRRLVPQSLAGRIALLLAAALVVAHVIALVVLGLEQTRFDRQARAEREVERLAALVPAMEAVTADARVQIAREASTRFARVRVGSVPVTTQPATGLYARVIQRRLSDVLGLDDVRVAIVDRAPRARQDDRRPSLRNNWVILISLPLSARDGVPAWLNVATSGAALRPDDGLDERTFFVVLGLSLVCVLGGAILIARRRTTLGHLAQAARAAGHGDRSARVPTDGPREMQDAARAFNAMQQQISQFDTERLRMLAAVGHDLRTPMTSLRLRAEMIEDADQRAPMIRILDEMAVMADGLVTYARDGRDAEDIQPIDLAQVLDSLCAERGGRFTPPGTPVTVMGRPVALRRAIGNVIDNAVRYGTPPEVTVQMSRSAATVTIADTGPGIAEDRIEAMFAPFARGETSRSNDTGGAGLGLSIARSILVAHGGSITLENRASGGLLVRVTIPV